MPMLATLALVAAALLTLLLAGVTGLFTMKTPHGPDAMGVVAFFILAILAWAFTLAAALVAASRGSFDWVSGSSGIPTLLVIATTLGLGGASVVAVAVSLDDHIPFRTLAGLVGALVVPLLAQAYVLALLWVRPDELAGRSWPRACAWPMAGIAAIAWGAGIVAFVLHQKERMKREVAAEEAREQGRREDAERTVQRNAEHDAALDTLPDDAPLPDFLSHLFIDKTDEHQKRAVQRILGLPRLRERLEERLAVPEPIQREYCANFIRMCDKPDPAWAPAVRKAILLLAEDYRLDAKDRSRGMITHVNGLTMGMLLTAQKFPGERFDAEVKELRAALETWPSEEERAAPLALADTYLSGKPIQE